jgi:hypothetical protein
MCDQLTLLYTRLHVHLHVHLHVRFHWICLLLLTKALLLTFGCEAPPNMSPPTPLAQSDEGWFAWRLNGGPTRFSRHISALTPWLLRPQGGDEHTQDHTQGCVREVREGDLIIITHTQRSQSSQNTQSCEVYTERLEGRALSAFGLKLNLNSATRTELRSIKGVGARLAQQIEAKRPWRSVHSLRRLRGVGPKRLKRLSRSLTLKPPRLLWPLPSDQLTAGGR